MGTHEIWQSVANGVSLGCLIGLLAVGYSLVYGVAKLINFAHGDLFTLAGYYMLFFMVGSPSGRPRHVFYFLVSTTAVVAFAWSKRFFTGPRRLLVGCGGGAVGAGAGYLLIGRSSPLFVALLGGIAFIAVAGVAFEYLVYRPLEGSPRLSYLVAAIGLSLSLQGLMQLLFGTERRTFPPSVNSQLSSLPVPHVLVGYFTGLDLLIIGFTVALTAVAAWFAKHSIVGMCIRATADEPVLAERLGLNVRFAKVQVFALGTALAAVCSFFFVARQRVLEPTLGYSQGILAFAAAVIGGIGSLGGSLLGGLFIGMVLSVLPLVNTEPLIRQLPASWVRVLPSLNLSDWGLGVVYLLMAVVLIVRPRGLLSERFWRDV